MSGATCAVLDVASGRDLYATGNSRVRPGSTMKPFTASRIPDPPRLVCSGKLQVSGRSFNCAHPTIGRPLDLTEALAYSCNPYFVNASRMLHAGRFAGDLRTFGFDAAIPRTPDELALMAIGEWGVNCSAVELAQAYRKLARLNNDRVSRGLIEAAEYGTARLAQPAGVRIAGKTGTTATHGCFAGWAPAEAPRVVVAVISAGGRGGAHAAPLARELFEKWL
jgi:cell division protein FtsI/penicillin-binding protein 2